MKADECATCHFPDPDEGLTDGLCGACWRFEHGQFEMVDDPRITFDFFGAIIQRAQYDAGSRQHGRVAHRASMFCECGDKAVYCAKEYLRSVMEYGQTVDFDGAAIADFIARVAVDSKGMLRMDPRTAAYQHRSRRIQTEAEIIYRQQLDDALERLRREGIAS